MVLGCYGERDGKEKRTEEECQGDPVGTVAQASTLFTADAEVALRTVLHDFF